MHDTMAYGRIFRISPKNKTLKTPDIDLSTQAGMVEAFCSPAVNVRYSGFYELSRRGKKTIEDIKPLFFGNNPIYQARACWIMSNLYMEIPGFIREAMSSHPDPRIRLTLYRAAYQNRTKINFTDLASIAFYGSFSSREKRSRYFYAGI